MKIDPSREHLATPGGWDTLRIVRYHNWFEAADQGFGVVVYGGWRRMNVAQLGDFGV